VNDTIVTLALAGVAGYFSVLIVRGISGYVRFRRLRSTALVTWPGPRPPHFPLLVLMGVINAVLAVLDGFMHHPLHKMYGPISIALYFIGVLPLVARIPMGFYGEGIWSERGFLPYNRIRRLAFRERPELVLLLVPRGSGNALRLQVPPAEYGAVRRVLGDKIRSHALNFEEPILGL
jgi:hypothetical protein